MTYSLLARDPKTGALGVATQSHYLAVGAMVTWGEAGVGVVATQAITDRSYGPRGLNLMRQGIPAEEALARLLQADPDRELRQIGYLDAAGGFGLHTGARCVAAAGMASDGHVAVLGNILDNDAVLDAALHGFQQADGDLAARLLAGLRGAEHAGGACAASSRPRCWSRSAPQRWTRGPGCCVTCGSTTTPIPSTNWPRILSLHGAFDELSRVAFEPAGPVLGRIGWYVESMLSPWLHRRNQYVTVSLPSARDLVELGVDGQRIAVVRNGLDEAPAQTLSVERAADPRVVVLSRLVPHKQIEDALEAVAALRSTVPGLHLDIVGDGWWHQRLVDHAALLGITDAVTFHGHVDDAAKHEVVQRSWVHVLPSRKEGWGLAVVEAAQHGVPTIGYRSSGGLADSIVDGVTGMLVDDREELVGRLEQLLADPVLRDQLGAKAQARSAEFSWRQSGDAMREVLRAVRNGHYVSGVV
ncbi:Glycogen synthase [Mycobacterium talmoniae]|uniref:Glycogen synthase n=1 Tax=Mycobacterium talmoniae TaxID=1858794 RepID=A0A2S8BM97_9MYCO|nr:Glycogen synthase [Mycobacterium talmoniae]